jgi:hypothetical protein
MITADDLINQLEDKVTATIILFSDISSVKLGEVEREGAGGEYRKSNRG